MGQRLHQGGVHGEQRVEEVDEADAERFGDQPVRAAVPVEAPRSPLLHDFEARLVVAVQDLLRDPAGGRPVDQGERVRAVPFDADDGDGGGGVGRDAAHRGGRPEVFELQAAITRSNAPETRRLDPAPALRDEKPDRRRGGRGGATGRRVRHGGGTEGRPGRVDFSRTPPHGSRRAG